MKIVVVDHCSAMREIVRRTPRKTGYGSHDAEGAPEGKQTPEAISAPPRNSVDGASGEISLIAARPGGDAT